MLHFMNVTMFFVGYTLNRSLKGVGVQHLFFEKRSKDGAGVKLFGV